MKKLLLTSLIALSLLSFVDAQTAAPAYGQCGGQGWCVIDTHIHRPHRKNSNLMTSKGTVYRHVYPVTHVHTAINVRIHPSAKLLASSAQTSTAHLNLSCIVRLDYSQCLPGNAPPAPTTTVAGPAPTSAPTIPAPPTTTVSGPAATGSQIRAVQAPVYHFYLQNSGTCRSIIQFCLRLVLDAHWLAD